MSDKPTPLPWKVGEAGAVVSTDRKAIERQKEYDRQFYSHLYRDRPEPERQSMIIQAMSTDYYGGALVCESCKTADRELIVRAVNAHDDLLAALTELLKQVDIRCGGHCEGTSPLAMAAQRARELVSQ